MALKKHILAINGSASENSSNLQLINYLQRILPKDFEWHIWDDLSILPHFRTALTDTNTPTAVVSFRKLIAEADGILICTPEYVFSIPSGLKNAIEWCVSTTVFSRKPTAIITASASGETGHKELQLVLRTVEAQFVPETTLLIQGVKGKIASNGEIHDETTVKHLSNLAASFAALIAENSNSV